MTATTEEIVAHLSESYQKLSPLLEYLRARLKYDTIRWLRTYGTKDDIVFSARTKTFERVYDKLKRRGIQLTRQTDLLEIILAEEHILDDVIGIRFICFESYNIFRLISYFMITERVTTSERTFYISRKTDNSVPLYRFLLSNGFSSVEKEGREYEDINFIARFSHPIDQYFGSEFEKFKSLARQGDPTADTSERLRHVNHLFDQLRTYHPTLIGAISKFPIECQIVTATQHIYNRTQRPQYEYILQRKDGESGVDVRYLEELGRQLGILKLNLTSADEIVYGIHRGAGIQYQIPLQIKASHFFSLTGRLPKDIIGKESQLIRLDALVSEIIDPHTLTLKRERIFGRMFEIVQEINKAISRRARESGDISAHNLLHIVDLPDLSHPEIVFWAYQRIVILIICNLLLYTPDPQTIKQIISKLTFSPVSAEDRSSEYRLSDPNIVIGRLFEKLEHVDRAVHSKLVARHTAGGPTTDWKDGYFSDSIFSDPLIQWRYASHMYSRQEYTNALQELRVGVGVYAELEAWKQRGVYSGFEIPEQALFRRRIVEYEICIEMASLRSSVSTVAGMLEFCNAVVAHSEGWNKELENVIEDTGDIMEQARCLCFQILIRLCEISAGGLKGHEIGLLRDEYASRFASMKKKVLRSDRKVVAVKSWWLLAAAIVGDGPTEKNLEQFWKSFAEVQHHTLERKEFEELCARLIHHWETTSKSVKSRNEFAASLLNVLAEQSRQISSSRALEESLRQQSKRLEILLDQLRAQLEKKGEISREGVTEKLMRFAGDTAEQFAIDVIISGVRGVLGF